MGEVREPVGRLHGEVPGARDAKLAGEDGLDIPGDEAVEDGVEDHHHHGHEGREGVALGDGLVEGGEGEADGLLLELGNVAGGQAKGRGGGEAGRHLLALRQVVLLDGHKDVGEVHEEVDEAGACRGQAGAGEEDGDGKGHHDGGDEEELDEDKEDGRAGVLDDVAAAQHQREQDGSQRPLDERGQKPRHPVHPVGQPHHAHRLFEPLLFLVDDALDQGGDAVDEGKDAEEGQRAADAKGKVVAAVARCGELLRIAGRRRHGAVGLEVDDAAVNHVLQRHKHAGVVEPVASATRAWAGEAVSHGLCGRGFEVVLADLVARAVGDLLERAVEILESEGGDDSAQLVAAHGVAHHVILVLVAAKEVEVDAADFRDGAGVVAASDVGGVGGQAVDALQNLQADGQVLEGAVGQADDLADVCGGVGEVEDVRVVDQGHHRLQELAAAHAAAGACAGRRIGLLVVHGIICGSALSPRRTASCDAATTTSARLAGVRRAKQQPIRGGMRLVPLAQGEASADVHATAGCCVVNLLFSRNFFFLRNLHLLFLFLLQHLHLLLCISPLHL
eukprot:m.104249 g.104249  ORF g.104249 m.104249 type:complete len:561 (+) comp15748_c0_seq2:307-1989(+)